MSKVDYTFELQPGGKTRYPAGPYDQGTNSPKYTLEISAPEHVRQQIEVKQSLVGTQSHTTWVWDIRNKSTWPVFVIIRKDGVLVQ
jgi:hypothetical protein